MKKIIVLLFVFVSYTGIYAISTANYNELKQNIQSEGFSDGKKTVLESAISDDTEFTCNQVVGVLKQFDYEADKLEALKLMKNNISDVERKFVIVNSFKYNADKEEAKKILEGIKSKSAGGNASGGNSTVMGGNSSASGQCICHIQCNNGTNDTVKIPNEGMASYNDSVCQQKAMTLCSSENFAQVRKSWTDCK